MATEKTDLDLTVTFQRLSSGSRVKDSVNLEATSPKDVEVDFWLGDESLLGSLHVTLDDVLTAIKLLRSR
jgi:hypothetical protein